MKNMDELLSNEIRSLRARAQVVAEEVAAPMAEQVDREGIWPEHTLRALREANLMGLQVPSRLGGHGQGLLALAVLTETLACACPSSAMCYGMHCVGTAVIAAKATPEQEQKYLRPIAAGQHLTTLALSESQTGAHFYLPQTKLTRADGMLVVNGAKQFVTNGSHADSYVVSTTASAGVETGEFSCLVADSDSPGMAWQEEWHGVGMRGNSSRPLQLDDVRLPTENLLGSEGDQVWYVFEVVAPYFLTAMAGTYLGVAQAALDIATAHLRSRRYGHSGESLAEVPVLQHRLAELWIAVQKTRGLLYNASRMGDLGDPQALPFVLACKADAGDTAVHVANEAMTLCGGTAYRENSTLARLLRDARASHVMAPTTDLLKQWTGRALLGLPLL
ncbi:MAG TPA: acyl-CoA dehydrogenase family protein [Tepidisphaeraceae bacterium]|jgi:alkylation response protein AidB-like acyl-CoA dehydrogenase